MVLPVYNEEEIIPELDRRLRAFLADVGSSAGSGVGESWEVIFVNDGSKDRSLPLLKELAATEPRYKVLSLSRNFGHQMAITAGLDRASGEAVVVMDADLQDPPGGGQPDGGQVARGVRRRVRCSLAAARRDGVQAVHRRRSTTASCARCWAAPRSPSTPATFD